MALIRLRHDMGMTQAAFARHFGVALPTVGRWESYSPPTGLNLERLALLAENNGSLSAAEDFRHALEKERGRVLPLSVALESEEESRYIFAVREVLKGRDPQLAKLRPALHRVLKPALKAVEFMVSEQRRALEAVAAVTNKMNKPPDLRGWKAVQPSEAAEPQESPSSAEETPQEPEKRRRKK